MNTEPGRTAESVFGQQGEGNDTELFSEVLRNFVGNMFVRSAVRTQQVLQSFFDKPSGKAMRIPKVTAKLFTENTQQQL